MLPKEENQREVSMVTHLNSSNTALSTRYNSNRHSQPRTYTPTFKPSPGFKKSGTGSQVVCEFCHLTGHTKEKCYGIHGYHSWHKSFGKPKPKPKFGNLRAMSTAQTSTNEHFSLDSGKHATNGDSFSAAAIKDNFGLSEIQYNQLMQMVQANMRTSQLDNQISINPVQFAGPY